jgi:asparagine synthase (glutamine-hydrolysing)
MCGIVALHTPAGTVAEETLEAALGALRHRGPDDKRTWLSPDRRVGLGHARLSIIDLATGQQPMANEDDSLQLVVNGEFYDYLAITDELQRQGHAFRTHADSEIALHLYEDLGTGFLDRLRGEFAFVLWDGRSRTLIAARDRFGIKPLFYTRQGETLLVASEIKALLAAGVPRAWDREAVAQLLTVGAPHPERTLFAGVRQVPPGHYLMARGDELRLVRYWDLDYPTAENGGGWQGSEEEYVEQFRTALDEAVRTRLRADVPVGFQLSGGVDSSAVLGFAATHVSSGMRAFTVCFDRPGYDESSEASETARRCGADWHPVRVTERDLADNLGDAVWHSETPCSNAHGVAKFLLSRAIRDSGYKVVLTGEGADEILAGYSFFGSDAPRLRRVFTPRARPGASNPGEGGEKKEGEPSGVPGWIEGNLTKTQRYASLLDPTFAAEFALSEVQSSLLSDVVAAAPLEGRGLLHRSLYLWARIMLPSYGFAVAGDRMEMAHSVEGRVPYLDHPLAELAARMPLSLMFHGLQGKHVLREAARSVLTDTVYARKKQPFWAPFALLGLGGPLQACVTDVLTGAGLSRLPFFDRGEVLELLDRIPQLDSGERALLDPILMRIVSLCVLQERFGL